MKSEYSTKCDECAPYPHYSHQIKQMGHLHTEDNWPLRAAGRQHSGVRTFTHEYGDRWCFMKNIVSFGLFRDHLDFCACFHSILVLFTSKDKDVIHTVLELT